jgi:hypothetical protein
MGLGVDLFPSDEDEEETEPAAPYEPQLWIGVAGQHLRFVDEELVLPLAVELALLRFRRPASSEFALLEDSSIERELELTGDVRFAIWQRRSARENLGRAGRWPRKALRTRCGYRWRLALDFARPPWLGLGVVLTPPAVSLRALDTRVPVDGEGASEVVWFSCGGTHTRIERR